MNLNVLGSHILSVANRIEEGITNLQLQKVLFFTVGMSVRQNSEEIVFFERIYNNDFEKWRYGPVVPSLYYRYNMYGGNNIEDAGEYNEQLKRFDMLIEKLMSVDVYELVGLSHRMSAWSENEADILVGKKIEPYNFEEIVRDFTENE